MYTCMRARWRAADTAIILDDVEQQFNGGIIRDQASTDPTQIATANCEAFQ